MPSIGKEYSRDRLLFECTTDKAADACKHVYTTTTKNGGGGLDNTASFVAGVFFFLSFFFFCKGVLSHPDMEKRKKKNESDSKEKVNNPVATPNSLPPHSLYHCLCLTLFPRETPLARSFRTEGCALLLLFVSTSPYVNTRLRRKSAGQQGKQTSKRLRRGGDAVHRARFQCFRPSVYAKCEAHSQQLSSIHGNSRKARGLARGFRGYR